ncbi:nitrite reductase [Photobacterium profundum]|uniref:TPR domain-containing protein n=1 Tax=Photobacterium profundum TaxID=74109 RepID=UPI003D137E0D
MSEFGTGLEMFAGVVLLIAVSLMLIWWKQLRSSDKRLWIPVAISLVLIGGSGSLYATLGSPTYHAELAVDSANDEFAGMTANEINQRRIEEIQNTLREDKQNSEAWYLLGNAYMYVSEFDKAALAFSYSARLADSPQANVFSAQATAEYYQNGQQLTENIQQLLDYALQLDNDNLPALMLLASDYFLNARYQKAIDTWQQALDSERSDLDRVALISAINRAKILVR